MRESLGHRWSTFADLLLVSLFGLPLLAPLARWSSVPCTHDGHLHYHRVAAMRHAWEQGLLFSRWLPDLAFGYGYPFFLYREPLPLYLTLMLHQMGLSLPAASNLFYMLALLASGLFTYLWVRDLFGRRAGLVAAVAYMAAPYQLADALVRGNQVESLALALFPLLLWSGRRFLLRGSAGWFLAAITGLILLALSHNISLLLFTPTLFLYLLAEGWLHHISWRPLLARLTLLLALGLGATAFYTGPALLEMDEVTLTLSTTTRNNDFHYNFTSVGEIVAPVAAEDPTLLNPPLPFRLGWAPLALALLGLASLAWNQNVRQRRTIALLALAALVFLLLSLPLALPLWESVPLISFVQFPWRLVGRASLFVAALAGAPFAVAPATSGAKTEKRQLGRRWLLPALAVTVIMVEAFPLLYPRLCPEEGFPTIGDVHVYEKETGLVGVDPEGSYFPRTVAERPQSSPLLADYAAGQTPQRFDSGTLPAGAQLLEATYRPNEAHVVVESPTSFQARYLTFAFPGWRVQVDGEPVTITPSTPQGLITFAVPAGQHTITISWGQTPLRLAFLLISFASLLGIGGAAWSIARQDGTRARTAQQAEPLQLAVDWQRGRVLLFGTALLLLAGKYMVDRVETPLRRSAPPALSQATALDGGPLHLRGYTFAGVPVAAGDTFVVDLAWQATAPPAKAYQSNLWLAGPAGQVWSEKETHRPRLYEDMPPTWSWRPGEWAWDSREIEVLPGTPPGTYDLVLTLFPLDSLAPLTLEREGTPVGPTAVIGQIEVVSPSTPPSLNWQTSSGQDVSGLRLLGHSQDRQEAAPGDPFLLTLFWEKDGEAHGEAEILLSLQDETRTTVQTWAIPPVREDYPPARWSPQERLRGQHGLRLPASLESGRYELILESVPVGTIDITAPVRTFVPPPFLTSVNVEFDGRARLAGYTTAIRGDTLSLTLVWQGIAEMAQSYRVFVHLIDDTETILAQNDGEPAAWSRPTSGWAPGEYIVDEHTLTLPEGAVLPDLQIRVGLYDPGNGERLRAAGADYLLLPLDSPE